MFLMMFIWIFVIVGLIYLFSKPFRGENYAYEKRPASSAEEILKQRYAKGEIKRDEFDAKKRDLAG